MCYWRQVTYRRSIGCPTDSKPYRFRQESQIIVIWSEGVSWNGKYWFSWAVQKWYWYVYTAWSAALLMEMAVLDHAELLNMVRCCFYSIFSIQELKTNLLIVAPVSSQFSRCSPSPFAPFKIIHSVLLISIFKLHCIFSFWTWQNYHHLQFIYSFRCLYMVQIIPKGSRNFYN